MDRSSVMDLRYGPDLRRQIEENLNTFPHQSLIRDDLRHAAVCLIVVGGCKEGQLLLTKRSKHLPRHGGQYALPGGRLDPGETPEMAALRELDEEMGLKLDRQVILGRLDDYATRSGFCITPIVMWGPANPDLLPDPKEVAEVFHIPLGELNRSELPEFHEKNKGESPVLSVNLPTTRGSVYAPTAALLYQFREVALRGQFTRVSHFDQPKFAWR